MNNAEGVANNSFDLLRLLAAGCVLLSHQMQIGGVMPPMIEGAYTLGDFGVLVFFSISGYLVAASWRRDPHLLRFAIRRLLRVWPGLAVSVLVVALIVGPLASTRPLAEYFADPRFLTYLGNLGFVFHDQLPLRFDASAVPASVNAALWTIPLEMICYAMLAALGMLGVLRRRVLSSSLLLIAVASYMVVVRRGEWMVAMFHLGFTAQYLIEFALFFFAGAVIEAWNLPRNQRRTRDVALCAMIAAVIAHHAHAGVFALWVTVPLAVACLGASSLGALRGLRRVGDLSYGVYLYGFPVQQLLVGVQGHQAGWPSSLLPVVLVTVCIAAVSWHGVEKPALARKPRVPANGLNAARPSM